MSNAIKRRLASIAAAFCGAGATDIPFWIVEGRDGPMWLGILGALAGIIAYERWEARMLNSTKEKG